MAEHATVQLCQAAVQLILTSETLMIITPQTQVYIQSDARMPVYKLYLMAISL